jgi:hypothetical protein
MRPPVKFFVPLLLAPALWSGSAHALTGSCLLSNLSGCNLNLDGVIFSNFSFTGFIAAASDSFELEGNTLGDTATGNRNGNVALVFSPVRNSQILNGSFTYTVTLTPNATSARAFNTATVSGNVVTTENGGSFTTEKTSSGLPVPATYQETNGTGSLVPATFNRSLTGQTFIQKFTFNPTAPDSLTRVRGTWTTYAATPGPLPLLGAATAFGLSRKIRSRIRSAA